MGHDGGRLSEESVAVVGIAIAGALLLQFCHPRNLGGVLRQVRLDRQPVFAGQLATSLQQLGGTGRYKTRGDDGADESVIIAELGDERLLACNVGVDFFREGVGTVAVHAHLADHSAHASLLVELHEHAGAVGMHGGEDDTAHGAKEPLGVDEAAIHALGIVDVGIFRLLRERVVLQPRQQFQVHGHALVVYLWRMDVHVVHGRNEQTVAEICHLDTFASQVLQITCHAQYDAVFHCDIAILEDLEMVFLFGKENMCFIYLFHSV